MRSMWTLLLGLAHAEPLTIATFNVWGLPWPIAPQRARRLRAIDGWLRDQPRDLVALQEVWRGARRHLGNDLTFPRIDGDSGLALYTPHPVERLGFVAFEQARGPDAWKAKGVWWVRVDAPDTPWTVGVLHLQAGRGPRNAAVRRAQIETVLASAPPGPLLLMGDFNLHRDPLDEAVHDRLVAAGLAEAHPTTDRGTSRYGRHRLDRVYVSAPAAWTVGTARTLRTLELSDHHPVVVELSSSR
jgi:endonuclease/exonuclease/phosphatase family metal-dependent hydrolase